METGKEQVIPVVKEELKVGKRAEERRYRIRAYVVETPVERDVTLRDERVIVEHRPVTGEAGLRAEVPQERRVRGRRAARRARGRETRAER